MQKKTWYLGYCTYKVGKNPFKIFHGKLGVYMLLLIKITIYYYNWYAKNGSHKLTAGFLVSYTYKVRKKINVICILSNEMPIYGPENPFSYGFKKILKASY